MKFQELDYQQTALGELILRRRQAVEVDGREVFEVKLNDEYLMSSLFHESEVALADLVLAELSGPDLDVVVGGLGLGYTAAAVLKYARVSRMVVVEALAPVIDWHQRELVPNGTQLSNDPRCLYRHGDFFDLVRGDGFDPHEGRHQFDAILLDIDHTPDTLLNSSHADLYSEAGMQRLSAFLKPNGVFGLWSNDIPDAGFVALMARVFTGVKGHTVTFANPLQGNTAANGVYIATLE